MAALQCVADNRGVFDLTAPNDPKLTLAPAVLQMKWQKAFFVYAKNESLFLCPLIKQKFEELTKNDPKLQQQAQNLGARAIFPAEAYESYAFNINLEGLKAADIPNLMNTVLIYEGKDGKLEFHHDGKANIAFADGHVESVGPDDVPKLIWNPKGKAND
ncbi:MAG TPA: H-X9-DG-CTERM domain-containing protein [Abditibacteriaceae bacterium]